MKLKLFTCAFVLLLLAACEPAEQKVRPFPIYDEQAKSNDTAGYIGVFNFPEMLIISTLDSADANSTAQKVAQNYRLLAEEIAATGVETEGPPGQMMHSNDVKNFKFECFSEIKKLPVVQPTRSRIYSLPACDMLVYNFYGPYQQLYIAYKDIYAYLVEYQLEQKGSMREFYISDPLQVSDSTKWLTKVMVPVARKNKEENAEKK
jgi:effector-binding domain-containing protein